MTLATQTEHASSRRVRALATAALLAALAAALGPLALPVGPVPITFQTFFVVLAALLLPRAVGRRLDGALRRAGCRRACRCSRRGLPALQS